MVLVFSELAEIPPFRANRTLTFQVFDEVGKKLLFLKRHFHDSFLHPFHILYCIRTTHKYCKAGT